MPILKLYKLTRLGKKFASNSKPRGRDKVLDYLYTNDTASEDEICAACAAPQQRSMVRGHIRQMIHRGLVDELGASRR